MRDLIETGNGNAGDASCADPSSSFPVLVPSIPFSIGECCREWAYVHPVASSSCHRTYTKGNATGQAGLRASLQLPAPSPPITPMHPARNPHRGTISGLPGVILCKFSIDELPQMVNMIRGHMSIVGPRPPIPSEFVHYTPYQATRLTLKPGLTCLWQVSGRSHGGSDEWITLDLRYIRRHVFGSIRGSSSALCLR